MDTHGIKGDGKIGLPWATPERIDPSPRQETFAHVLDAEALAHEVAHMRNKILATQKPAAVSSSDEDIAYIREHGMQAYAEEVRRQKIEEMREKILTSMGLSEEALSEMPASQRSLIEQMISDEIEKRLEANSLMNNNPANDNGTYLKSMMMANRGSGFFSGTTQSSMISFREHFAQIDHQDTAFTFFKESPDKK